MEIKQQTPSVIARLMGLDDLPHQKPIHKQHRVLSEDYLLKSASIGLLEKQLSYSGRSFGMSRREVPELKDKKASWATKASIRFENRNSADVQCVKLDEKILDSEKFSDTVKNIRRDKEISLEHLQKRDNLFPGHPHDLLHIHYPLGQRTFIKLSSAPYFTNNQKGEKLEKRTARRKVLRSPQKLQYDSDTSNIQAVMTSYSSLLDPKNQERTSYPSSNRSIYTRAVKNIDPEQQEMTKRVQIGKTTDCPTTFEMIYSADQKICEKTYKFDKRDWSIKYSQNTETLGLSRRFGVNNMKNNIIVNSSGFRQFPSFRNAVGNAKSRNGNYAFHNGKCLRRGEAITEARNMLRYQILYEKGKSNHEDSRFRCEASHSPATDIEHNHSTRETLLDELGSRLEDKNLSEETSTQFELSGGAAVPFLDSNFNDQVQKAWVIQDELHNSSEECIMLKGSGTDPTSLSICANPSSSVNADVVEENNAAATDIVGLDSSRKEPKAEQPESTNRKLTAKDDISSSEVSRTSVGQESPRGSPEDGLIFPGYFETEPEFAANWRDTHQPSPNSVLDPPYEEENISDIECFGSSGANLNGLWKQLQLLRSDGEDTFSEGLGMMVSSDEDSRNEFVDFTEGNGNLVGVFRAEESRDFSYLIDVLDEAGLYDENWEISFDRCHSSECALNPSLFEVIEKKYGDQTCWKKSERRLLFDRINSGLVEILQPIMDIPEWANPWSTWLHTRVRRDVVEEKLWNLLVNQEKDVNKGLSEKAVGGDIWWLKLGDDIDSIVGEIDKVLFDELVTELGSV